MALNTVVFLEKDYISCITIFFILQFEGIMRILAVGKQISEPLEIMDLFLVSSFYTENEESTI